MQIFPSRSWAASGAALLGAGVIAVAPLTAPTPAGPFDVALTATEMTLDLVRHGESEANAAHLLGTWPPGPGLTPTGEQEAQDVANALYAQYGADYYDGIFASLLTRTQETAAPLAEMLNMAPQVLAGLNEIAAPAIAENLPEISPAGLLYILPPIMWSLGLYLVPSMGTIDANGVVFEERVNDAMQSMLSAGDTNDDGQIHNVAYSSLGTILLWSLMNVKNPDYGVIISHLVPNTGVIEIQGSPESGWTLLSWDGEPVGPASLPVSLFVDTRDLITTPQIAFYDILRALVSADPAMIATALQDGIGNVVATTLNYPSAVIGDIVAALGGADTADILPAATTDAGAVLPAELDSAVGDSLAALTALAAG